MSCILGFQNGHWMDFKDDAHANRKADNIVKVRELLIHRLTTGNMKQLFSAFDRDKSGSISRRELQFGLELQGSATPPLRLALGCCCRVHEDLPQPLTQTRSPAPVVAPPPLHLPKACTLLSKTWRLFSRRWIRTMTVK
jgi:hypothetical protein